MMMMIMIKVEAVDKRKKEETKAATRRATD